ncbi:MAG TPA: beta-propeller domain-containing protein, partial [Kofleriaceae bacterium]
MAGVAAGANFLSDARIAAQPAATPPPAPKPPLVAATSCDALRDLMIDTVIHHTVAGYSPYQRKHYHRHPARRQGRPDTGVKPKRRKAASPMRANEDFGASQPSHAELARPSEPSHHTTTNIQEKGVDEADIIKTDGKYVYTVRGDELVVAKTWPVDQTAVAARVRFNTLVPQQLYLRGTDVIVQGQSREKAQTRVIVVDVSDRERPSIKRIVDVDGQVVSSRLIRDDLFLVQASSVEIPQKLYEVAQNATGTNTRDPESLRPWEAQAKLAQSLRGVLATHITRADVDAAMPRVRSGNVTRQLACGELHIPPSTTQLQMTTLAKISTTSAKAERVGAMAAGAQVYSSLNALYVTAQHNIYGAKAASYGTQVHQFALGDANTRPSYVASGRVEGYLLNQFSMSEHAGDLRIATTDQNLAGNNLFVMRPNGKKLEVIGSLRGMGKNERIYSGRIVGEQGYIVTFRQTDPLYTLDLKDPRNPKVAGELKVNGFSNYIHPIGGGLLLAIGQDADANGRQLGLHLQVFDVNDPAKPTRKFHEKLPAGTTSTAQHDPKSFLWDRVTKTLAVPIVQHSSSETVAGLAVYGLDKTKGFTSKGRLDHAALGATWYDEQCAAQRKAAPKASTASLAYCNPQSRRQYRAQHPISRSLVVDSYIVSLSTLGL